MGNDGNRSHTDDLFDIFGKTFKGYNRKTGIEINEYFRELEEKSKRDRIDNFVHSIIENLTKANGDISERRRSIFIILQILKKFINRKEYLDRILSFVLNQFNVCSLEEKDELIEIQCLLLYKFEDSDVKELLINNLIGNLKDKHKHLRQKALYGLIFSMSVLSIDQLKLLFNFINNEENLKFIGEWKYTEVVMEANRLYNNLILFEDFRKYRIRKRGGANGSHHRKFT